MNYKEFSEVFKEIHWRKECAKRLKNLSIEQKKNEEKVQKVIRSLQIDNQITKKHRSKSKRSNHIERKYKEEQVAFGKWLCKNAYYECDNKNCK